MSLRRGQLMALRGIERDLADSDPGLDALFLSFASQAGRPVMPWVETVGAGPFKLLARLRRRRTLTERMKDWCAQNWNDP